MIWWSGLFLLMLLSISRMMLEAETSDIKPDNAIQLYLDESNSNVTAVKNTIDETDLAKTKHTNDVVEAKENEEANHFISKEDLYNIKKYLNNTSISSSKRRQEVSLFSSVSSSTKETSRKSLTTTSGYGRLH